MPVTIKRLQFGSATLPTEVRVVLSDGETKAESEVWISARFPIGARSTDRLPLLAREALDELQRLIDEGRENV